MPKKLSTAALSRHRSPAALWVCGWSMYLVGRPDRGQPDAVLTAVKAPPGSGRTCGERVATVGLDGGCARRPGARAGRDGETDLRSNKETDKKEAEGQAALVRSCHY
jgi:hypothetical protein